MAQHINVNLLAGLAVAGNAADEKMMASGCNSDGVVAGRVGLQRRRDIAGFVHSMRHSHHVVKLGVVLKY